MAVEHPEEKLLMQKIARVFDEAKSSRASHIRKLKELSALRSSIHIDQFFTAFSQTLTPIFTTQRRFASVERSVQFVAIFDCLRDPNNSEDCDAFFEQFLRFLIAGTAAANRTARFRACQIISEIIMRLPDDAEVSNDLWDEVIDCIKVRVGDRVPIIRTFAVRALSRFANDAENSDILELLLEKLPLEQNPEVRKTILLSLPPSNATSTAIIDCTLDVSESVRKTAYSVLASKFPLQSLSIKQRTVILQRGLSDRSAAVTKECLKLMKDEWLMKSCNGDAIELLKYLDVETYESIGVSVMEALLKAGLVKLHGGQSIQQFLSSDNNTTEGCCTQLVEAEVSLYLRTLCKHLQTEAQAKGSDAAMTSGTEAAVYASEASDSNELLEKILPESVANYINLVKAHIVAGQTNRFTARQLLLLGSMLDFSDASNRKVAAVFVVELLKSPLPHEVDEDGNKVVIGDGISLGGERDWADAVSALAKKVHATPGEFEHVVLSVVAELAQPCRERTADFLDWMHCLSVTGLVLEHAKSLRWMPGNSIGPSELLQSLLLPGAKHIHLDVQRAAIRCLGLFGILERILSEDLVKQLRLSYVKGPPLVSSMASKALMDLATWHGPQEVDKATNRNLTSQFKDHAKTILPVCWSDTDADLDIELIDLLYAGFDRTDFGQPVDADENESVHAVLAEGFAKILLLSENYPTISVSSHPILLTKLINLYFSSRTSELQRLKQCLSVFFEHYPSLSVNHKKCICKAFLPAMRSMWPGINGTTGVSNVVISNMRKRAVQASRFMLQMLQAPLYPKEVDQNENNSPDPNDSDYGDEELAICIAAEILSFQKTKNAAEKSYVSAICKILVLLRFKQTKQVAVKLMKRLVNRIAEAVPADKDVVKELKQMSEHLKACDTSPDEPLQPEQAKLLLEKLEIQLNIDDDDESSCEVEPTPVPKSTRPVRGRRRARREHESSSSEEAEEEDEDEASVAPANPVMASVRSQRASKSAALSKMRSTAKPVKIVDEDGEDDEDEEDGEGDGDESAVTTEDESD